MRPECIKLSVAPMAFILLAVGVAVGAGQRVPSDEGGSDYDAAQRPPPPSLDEDVVLLTRVCMVAPAFYPTPGEPGKAVAPAAEVGLILMQSMLLALEHVNSRNCTVLGDGCATLLDAGGGRRVRLRPYLVNLPSEDAQASGPAVQACANTDAQFIAASFTSSQTSLVASFVSALGRLLVVPTASSPALALQDVYPNLVRTLPDMAANMLALVHFSNKLGWREVVVLHNQDLFGSHMTDAFTEEARMFNLKVSPISLGSTQSNSELQRASQQLVLSQRRVVILVTFPMDVLRVLQIIRQEVTEAGLDYRSFSFMQPMMGMQDFLGAFAPFIEDQMVFQLIQGMMGVSVHVSPDKMAHFQETVLNHPVENMTTDIEKYLQNSGTWHGSIDKAAFRAALSNQNAGNTATSWSLATYDAIWSIAIGAAAAARFAPGADGPGAQVTGTDVMQLIQKGAFPEFEGAAGRRGFLPNGGTDLNHTFLEISNYGTLRGSESPRLAVVAKFDLQSRHVEMVPGQAVVWANGREYPYVPSDSQPTRMLLLPVLIGTAVGFASLLVLLAAIQVWHVKRLRQRVNAIMNQAWSDIDLDSPLAKILDFLRRYQGARYQRPTKADAQKLEDLLIFHSGKLTVPDLENEFSHLNAPDAIKRFLMGTVVTTSFPSFPSSTSSFGGTEGSFSGGSSSMPGERDDVPGPLQCSIANDLFLDLVTPSSHFQLCACPIRTVVQHATDRFQLVRSRGAFGRLLRFAEEVEKGYPDTNYHCKLHGADVTNRLLAMMNHAGLVELPLSPDASSGYTVGLVGMVAAIVHDYRHPQVNNAFLVEEENSMALDFNNQAAAENYALRESMKLLMDSNMNFLASNKPEVNADNKCGSLGMAKRKAFRNMVIQMVLATDMSRHFDLVSHFTAQVVQNKELRAKATSAQMWASMNHAQRLLTLQVALKVADMGHCALPWGIHKLWLERLENEFFAQGDREKEAGLKVSPLMDRALPGVSAPENQVGFFKVIVVPLLKIWTDVFPSCLPLLHQAEENLRIYSNCGSHALAVKGYSQP